MTTLQFVCQDALENLISQGKTRLNGIRLTVDDTGEAYQLTPAVKVLSCETSPHDPLRLNDKFIPVSILESAGADIYLNSIILHHHSYCIDQGYICNRIDDEANCT